MKLKKKTTAVVSAAIVTAAMSLLAAGTSYAAASGDANGDGSFGISDVVAFCKYLTTEGTVADAAAADMNGDGKLNAVDLTLMKRALLTASTEPETPENPDNPDQPQNPTDDNYVTQITYANGSVTLKNASDQVVDAANAENVKVENGTYVTVTKPTTDGTTNFGDINLDGECSEGQFKVDVDETQYETGQVTVNLRGLTLSNSKDSPVYVNQIADEFVITIKKDTVNTISDGTDYQNADQSAGAIYSLDDLKIKGKGTLIVNGNCADGIVSKDDIKLWNGDIQVTAVDDCIRGKDSIRVGDPDNIGVEGAFDSLKVTLTSKSGDGLKSTNDTADSGKGYIKINGGTVSVKAENGDGIQATQEVIIAGGDIDVYTYQGSGYTGSGSSTGQQNPWGGRQGGGGMGMDGNANKTEISAKGIKAVGLYDESGSTWQSMGNITVTGGTLTLNTSDDSFHCGGDMVLTGGVFNVQTADDAFHSDHKLTIGTENAGTYDDVQIYVSKCYEGVEGVYIYQNSGTVYVVSGDDGYNAAGGADGSGNQQQGPGGGFFPGGMSSTYGELWLRGGMVVVNSASGDHDAFDSNGDINITGGYYFCNGQEPLDCGDSGYSIKQTGGTYVKLTAGNTNLNTTYTFKDASGNAVVSFKAASGSPGISSKDNSTAYSGTTVSGSTQILADCPYAVTLGGNVSGGTQITGSGSSSGFGPGGGW